MPPFSLGSPIISSGSVWALCTLGFFCPTEVCYDGLGCFDSDFPWIDVVFRPSVVLPQTPEVVHTRFLYTSHRGAQEVSLPTSREDGALAFNASNPLVIIVHGFMGTMDNDWIVNTRDALLQFHACSVVRVGWNASPAPTLAAPNVNIAANYLRVVADARVVGAEVGLLIARMAERLDESQVQDFLDGIQILGFSLGAHIASYAGQFVQEKLDAKIGRITGLDPAGPYFQWADPVVRLDPSDAAFVDVIHTDGSSSFLTGFGADQAMGHVDFYPNGGQHQPGCLEQQLALDVSEVLGGGFGNLVVCHHQRACHLYMETLIPRTESVEIEKPEPEVFVITIGELKLTFSLRANERGDGDAQTDDSADLGLSTFVASRGTFYRGQCDFGGVLCTNNLDPFGEMRPACEGTCRGLVPANASSLCVPMGREAASFAHQIKAFRRDNNDEDLKMYLETNGEPPFCKR